MDVVSWFKPFVRTAYPNIGATRKFVADCFQCNKFVGMEKLRRKASFFKIGDCSSSRSIGNKRIGKLLTN